jgi:hypothetical protein
MPKDKDVLARAQIEKAPSPRPTSQSRLRECAAVYRYVMQSERTGSDNQSGYDPRPG